MQATLDKVRRLARPRRFSPAAVEFDGIVVRAAQLRLDESGPTVHATAEFPSPAGEVERAERLARVLERRGFHGRAVVLCAPAGMLDSDLIDLKEVRGDAAEHVRTLLARAAGIAGSRLNLAYWPRGGEGRGATAYAVALRHEHAEGLIGPMQAAGLELTGISCAAAALARLALRVSPLEGCSAVVRLGSESVVMVLVQGRQVIYQRILDAPGLAESGAVRADVAARAIAAEVMQTLECVPRTFPGLAVERLSVSGPGLRDGPLLESLRAQLPELHELCPRELACDVAAGPLDGGFDITLGLALAEVEA